MINIELLRDDPEKVKKGVAAKQLDPAIVDEVLRLDEQRRNLMQEVQALQAEKNKFAKASGSESDPAQRAKDIEGGKRVKAELKNKEPDLEKIEKEFKEKF